MRLERLSWTDFKTIIIIGMNLSYSERDVNGIYEIWASDGATVWKTEINKIEDVTDKNDYENNYRANVHSPNITIINDEDIRRLAVEAKISEGITATETRYTPKFYKSNSDISLSQSSDTILADINVNGKIDAISVNFTRDDVEFVLEIDGTEILRIKLDELDNECDYNLFESEGGDDDD